MQNPHSTVGRPNRTETARSTRRTRRRLGAAGLALALGAAGALTVSTVTAGADDTTTTTSTIPASSTTLPTTAVTPFDRNFDVLVVPTTERVGAEVTLTLNQEDGLTTYLRARVTQNLSTPGYPVAEASSLTALFSDRTSTVPCTGAPGTFCANPPQPFNVLAPQGGRLSFARNQTTPDVWNVFVEISGFRPLECTRGTEVGDAVVGTCRAVGAAYTTDSRATYTLTIARPVARPIPS